VKFWKILRKIERNKVGKREIPSARAHLISEPIKTFLSELVEVLDSFMGCDHGIICAKAGDKPVTNEY
jgi:hypothetical protein